ncbi:MAG: inositol 2-dehydrogenase [Caldilineales bacterium]|nr:inositol 2-dehydrogenase [Caldilineales bacterium]MDW8316715.1 inositol 2-dehydrogenase [Anaerolineae bacterium]
MSKTLNVGIIGAGRIGQVHAATLAYRVPEARLAAVADLNLAAAQALADRFRVPVATDNPDVIFADPTVDAVLICSVTATHAPFIEAAAAAGKHVFCEKPIALDLAQIDRALAAVAKAGVKLQVGFNRRFDANFRRVRRAIESGEIGQPALLHIVSRDPAPPPIEYVKGSGGMFLDMTIHDFDMARFLIGDEIEEVYAQAGVTVDPSIGEAGDVDTAVTLLRFANGVIGTIDNCRRATYGYDQRVEVFGSKGAISTMNNYPNAAIVSDAASVRRDLPLHFFMDRYVESFAAEVMAFVDAVLNDQPVPVTGLDGRAPVVMALAAMKSYREGRPVKVSEIG